MCLCLNSQKSLLLKYESFVLNLLFIYRPSYFWRNVIEFLCRVRNPRFFTEKLVSGCNGRGMPLDPENIVFELDFLACCHWFRCKLINVCTCMFFSKGCIFFVNKPELSEKEKHVQGVTENTEKLYIIFSLLKTENISWMTEVKNWFSLKMKCRLSQVCGKGRDYARCQNLHGVDSQGKQKIFCGFDERKNLNLCVF